MKKKRKIVYLFGYSRSYEGYKRFFKLARLLKFLQKVPEHELRYTQVMRWDGKIYHVGCYYVKKKGGLSVHF